MKTLLQEYLPIGGYKPFIQESIKLAYGAGAACVKENRVAAIQTLSGAEPMLPRLSTCSQGPLRKNKRPPSLPPSLSYFSLLSLLLLSLVSLTSLSHFPLLLLSLTSFFFTLLCSAL